MGNNDILTDRSAVRLCIYTLIIFVGVTSAMPKSTSPSTVDNNLNSTVTAQINSTEVSNGTSASVSLHQTSPLSASPVTSPAISITTSPAARFTSRAKTITFVGPDESIYEGICYSFDRKHCNANASRKNISKELEPTCYPKIIRCHSNYCYNFFVMAEDLVPLDGWYGNIFYSGCATRFYYTPGCNNNICKYTTSFSHDGTRYYNSKPKPEKPYDYNTCTCKGLLCNYYDNDTEPVFKYTRYTTIDCSDGASSITEGYSDGASNITADNETESILTALPVESTALASTNWRDAFIATLVVAIAIISILAVCWGLNCYGICLHHPKKTSTIESSDVTSDELENSESDEKVDINLELAEFTPLSKGRFGKLLLLKDVNQNGRQVVAKVYSRDDERSWANEVNIYEHPGVAHENILRFFGSGQRQSDCFLFLQYHSNGSLRDYLKEHTVDWDVMIQIMHTMARGVAHLHQPMLLPPDNKIKHPIGHRDIKSSNIILDGQLNAKVADFNLAQVLESSTLGNAGDQERVGTIRYMAPEILSGQISYTREAILQADVYSMSLVMWEVFSRCDINTLGSEIYHLPFYEFISEHPTPEEMHQIVFVNNHRPSFSDKLTSPIVQEVISTIRDSWEKEGDVRLTACCIEMRLQEFVSPKEGQGVVNTSYV